MVTMVDEIFDRMYQEGRADIHRDFGRVFGSIGRQVGETLKVFHDLQWNAPWIAKARTRKDVGCA